METIAPLLGGLMIGIMLGLLGSGGSILTVPVLVYLAGHHSKVAIAESLFIVGIVSLLGVFPYAWSRMVDWRNVVYFGIPGMAGTYAGAWLAGFVSGGFQLVLFSGVMLFAAILMFRNTESTLQDVDATEPSKDASEMHQPGRPHSIWKIAFEGVIVGLITGLVGVGGGFLIVPALVLLGGLSMHIAIGTSLAIITLKSLSGFFKYMDVLNDLQLSINWETVVMFIVIGGIGAAIGKQLSNHIQAGTLRRVFAVFLVVMGVFSMVKELPSLVS